MKREKTGMTEYNEQFQELKQLQQKHCEIIHYLDEFCTENGIEWCLAFGSALGARRHGGPIPWDDDADIYMTAAGYAKFRQLFQEKGDKEHFYLQEFEGIDGMAYTPKLRMNGTTFIEETYKDYDMHHGIFVDIFVLHECPPNQWEKFKGVVATCYLTLKRLSNRNYQKRKIVKPIMWFLRLFPKKFGFETAYKQLYKWDNKPQKKPQKQLVDWELYTGNPKWFVDKDVILPPVRMEYNGYQFCVPHNVERYLEIAYGDWKQIPPMEKIHWAQHAIKWSTTEDFHQFAKNVHDYSDEKF